MLKGLTSTFKNNCNNVELTYKEYVKLGNDIIPVKATLKDDCYENGNFIGTFILKEIQFETEATYEFRNKEFEYYKVVDNESIKIGTFISTDITINDTTDIVKVIGMDYGLKTQVEYTSSLDYSSGTITLMDVWNECCTLSGLESGIDNFPNSNFIVDSDQFTGTGATIRDVFKGIAMSSGTFVKVMNDDKIYLIFNEITSDITSVDVNGSATIQNGLKYDSLEMYGNTTQSGTPTPTSPQPINVVSGRQEVEICGKNLYSGSNVLTDRFTYIITSKIGETYTLSFKGSTTETGGGARVFFRNCNDIEHTSTVDNRVVSLTSTMTNYSLTITSTINGYLFIAIAGTVSNFTFENIMLEKNNQATTYEAYKRQSYEINLGKNLFKPFNFTKTSNGITFTYSEDGYINVNNTSTGTALSMNSREATPYLITLQAGTYTISGYTNDIRLEVVKTDGTRIVISSENQTFALTETTSIFIRANIQSGKTFDNVKIYPQLEKGSESTSYSAYKTPIELCGIGDYKDRIYKDNDTWYLEKNITKVVFNGTENWTINGYTFVLNGAFPLTLNSLCSHFIKQNDDTWQSYNTSYRGKYTLANSINQFKVMPTDANINTVELWKQWLQSNNVLVYYQLATPTTEEITDTELISQLESLQLLSGLNNISITSGDLPAPLKLYYYSNEFDIVEDYTELEDKRDTHPWTCLRLGLSNIDGENVDYIDQELVDKYGENWLILNDNPFAYNQSKRELLIENIFNQIKEFGYSAFVSKVAFKPYLTCGDLIRFRNRDKELVNSIVLRYTHNAEELQIEAPSETSATVNYKYPLGAIDIAKQTQIIVDKDSVRIDSLTSQTQTIQDDLRENYYTLEQTNELIQTSSTGLTNTFSKAGGNNIFRNTGLWFSATTNEAMLYPNTDVYPSDELFMGNQVTYEFWSGKVEKVKNDKAVNMSSMLLMNDILSQEQLVPNGKYTIAFKYKKRITLSNISVKINDVIYPLTSNDEATFTQTIDVSSQHISLQFISDIDESCEIYDLMVNVGDIALAYSQNANETTTDTVNISKGITITSSDTDVKFKADVDGIRTLDRSENVLTKFTDTGMTTKEAIIESKSQIVGLLYQEVGGQTWITRL